MAAAHPDTTLGDFQDPGLQHSHTYPPTLYGTSTKKASGTAEAPSHNCSLLDHKQNQHTYPPGPYAVLSGKSFGGTTLDIPIISRPEKTLRPFFDNSYSRINGNIAMNFPAPVFAIDNTYDANQLRAPAHLLRRGQDSSFHSLFSATDSLGGVSEECASPSASQVEPEPVQGAVSGQGAEQAAASTLPTSAQFRFSGDESSGGWNISAWRNAQSGWAPQDVHAERRHSVVYTEFYESACSVRSAGEGNPGDDGSADCQSEHATVANSESTEGWAHV